MGPVMPLPVTPVMAPLMGSVMPLPVTPVMAPLMTPRTALRMTSPSRSGGGNRARFPRAKTRWLIFHSTVLSMVHSMLLSSSRKGRLRRRMPWRRRIWRRLWDRQWCTRRRWQQSMMGTRRWRRRRCSPPPGVSPPMRPSRHPTSHVTPPRMWAAQRCRRPLRPQRSRAQLHRVRHRPMPGHLPHR